MPTGKGISTRGRIVIFILTSYVQWNSIHRESRSHLHEPRFDNLELDKSLALPTAQRFFAIWSVNNLPLDAGTVPPTVCLRVEPFIWLLAFLAHALLQKGRVFIPSKYLGLTEQNYTTKTNYYEAGE